MSGILTNLAQTLDEEYLRAEYNAAQQRYSAFKELLPEHGEGTRGTLFWEFGKAMCQEYDDNINPAILALLSLHAADTFIALGKTLKGRVPSL